MRAAGSAGYGIAGLEGDAGTEKEQLELQMPSEPWTFIFSFIRDEV